MYYFAYGSNMNHGQMKERCPGAQFITKAYLKDYKFIYDGCSRTWNGAAVGNIVKSKNSIVWGGLFNINKDNLAMLDYYEGYPNFYLREKLVVLDKNKNTYKAYVYLRKEPKETGEPSKSYRDAVRQGARDCGLGENYILEYL